jgi:hypothetical protein
VFEAMVGERVTEGNVGAPRVPYLEEPTNGGILRGAPRLRCAHKNSWTVPSPPMMIAPS